MLIEQSVPEISERAHVGRRLWEERYATFVDTSAWDIADLKSRLCPLNGATIYCKDDSSVNT